MPTGLEIRQHYGNMILKWQRDGQSEVQSCTVGLYNAGGARDWQDICDDIFADTIVSAGLGGAAFMHTDWSFLGIQIYYRPTALGPLEAVEHVSSIAGTYAPANYQSPPISTCVIARKKCTVLGKQYRGRMYLPSMHLPNSAIGAGGLADSTYTAQYQTAVADLFTSIHANSDGPFLLHGEPKTGGIPAPTPITSCIVQQQIGTQRRRLS